jgi:hypothetical protein
MKNGRIGKGLAPKGCGAGHRARAGPHLPLGGGNYQMSQPEDLAIRVAGGVTFAIIGLGFLLALASDRNWVAYVVGALGIVIGNVLFFWSRRKRPKRMFPWEPDDDELG